MEPKRAGGSATKMLHQGLRSCVSGRSQPSRSRALGRSDAGTSSFSVARPASPSASDANRIAITTEKSAISPRICAQ